MALPSWIIAERRGDAKAIYRHSGGNELIDLLLVETTAQHDLDVPALVLVGQSSDCKRFGSEIAAVGPHRADTTRGVYGVQCSVEARGFHGAASCIVGANEQRRAVQLCPGIQINDKHGKARAPDINLLKEHTPMAPTHLDLTGCWDAKFSAEPLAPLRDEAVADCIASAQM